MTIEHSAERSTLGHSQYMALPTLLTVNHSGLDTFTACFSWGSLSAALVLSKWCLRWAEDNYVETNTPLLSWISWWRSWFTHIRRILKSTRASTHPCLTPVPTGKGVDSYPAIDTPAFIPSWKYWRLLANLFGHLKRRSISHKRSLCSIS